MSAMVIFLIGVVAVGLLTLFTYVSFHEVLKGEQEAVAEIAARTARATAPPQPAAGPMRIVVAIDGTPCSDRAVDGVAARPWPPGSQIELVTVVHTRLPMVPDPFLGGAAAHVTALEEARRRAPERIRAAEARLASRRDVALSSTIIEGPPAQSIVDEATRWQADLVIVGSHGFGPAERLVLGSVSQAVAQHAPCSVEIVRCREAHPHDG